MYLTRTLQRGKKVKLKLSRKQGFVFIFCYYALDM